MVAPGLTLSDIFDAAFDPIRQHGRTSAAVLARLLDVIAVIVPFTPHSGDRDALRRHAQKVSRAAFAGLPEADDRLAIEVRFDVAMAALDRWTSHPHGLEPVRNAA